MEQAEIEVLVGEAENRVERLRSLYDQYFMGIERIEPQIARKDVERRIQILRRTQIRNTALRFRFQNVLLRYNTFSAHWMRICRQIEDGTYKHHLRKAKERFDPKTIAARDAARQGALEYGDTEPPPAPGYDLSDDIGVDVDFEEEPESSRLRAALRSYTVPQELVAHSVAGHAMRAPPALPPTPPSRGSTGESSLDRSTERAPPPVPSTPPAKAPPPLPSRAAPPLPGKGAPPPLPPKASAPGAGKTIPPPLPPRAPAPPAAAGAPTAKPPPPPARPPAPGGAGPAATVKPPLGPTGVAKPAPTTPGVVARPGAPPPARPAAAPAPSPARPAEAHGVTDERVRQIYSKYVETRRSLNESTAAITMDSMARSLRDSSEKLRQKHGGKNVDFEVQVKDGKTVLKPIVK